MGTNYYAEVNACSKCKRCDSLHIGKSSAGWKFMFQSIPNKAETIREWLLLLQHAKIIDEYGRHISYKKFWKFVEAKQKESSQCLLKDAYTNEGYDFMRGNFS